VFPGFFPNVLKIFYDRRVAVKRTLVALLACLSPFLWLCPAPAQENQKSAPDSERARVFITDSRMGRVMSWGKKSD
jgi:hypothetical protein